MPIRRRAFGTLPVLVLAAGTLPAQPGPTSVQRISSATSMPNGVAETVRVDSLVAEMTRSGDLVLATARPDRQVPGRTLEHFSQVHGGLPVLGAGLTRQRAGEATLWAFGTIFSDIDVSPDPSMTAEAALAWIQEMAGVGPATTEPPILVVFPTPLGRLVLGWSATMRDYRTWFIDAHSGELLHRQEHVRADAAVGFGLGITGAPQKLSVWKTGQTYEAWDRLRPAEIVTLDGGGDLSNLFALLEPAPAWEDAVASDDDNEWSDSAVVDGQAHLGFTYDYLFQSQSWRGLDGQDGRIFSVVNVGDFYNAFFVPAPFGPQGTGAVVFGQVPDGPPLVPLDIVAHEVMHGVTDSALMARTGLPLIGRLDYTLGASRFEWRNQVFRCGDSYTLGEDESGNEVRAPLLCLDEDGKPTRSREGRFAFFMDHGGAIHEAYSDIVGTAVEFAVHPPGEGPLRADYMGGEDAGDPIRRIDDPRSESIGPFFFPDAYGQEFRFLVVPIGENLVYFTGLGMTDGQTFRLPEDGYDAGHWNSTILSHAYYLAIEGGTHASSGRTVAGVGVANRTGVEQAFFRALVDLAPPDADYPTMGIAIRQAVVDLHGVGSAVHTAVDQALTAVGL